MVVIPAKAGIQRRSEVRRVSRLTTLDPCLRRDDNGASASFPRRPLLKHAAIAAAVILGMPLALAAQDDPEGVRLDIRYSAVQNPGIVVLPFEVDRGTAGVAGDAREIVRRDLELSNRFDLVSADGWTGGDLNLPLWRERGADWVVEGRVTPATRGTRLEIALHDAIMGEVRERRVFDLPEPGDTDFRLAVHRASDAVVRWATGEPGIAATRIAFVREGRDSKEIYLVDWDGENLRRVTRDGSITLSPAWSPDGRRLAYTSYRNGVAGIYEREIATGAVRTITEREGTNITPAYASDGRSIYFAGSIEGNTEILVAGANGRCCERRTRGRQFDSLSPSFSPDGSRLAFVSNRIGQPHLYVMAAGGGEARQITDYRHGGGGAYNVAPDWAPRGDRIAFETRVRGVPQLAMVRADGSDPRILTSGARHADPSWAPDGRHLVLASPDRDGGGLFVLDTVTGDMRSLVGGRGFGLPAWSPALR